MQTDWPTEGMPLAWGLPDNLAETSVPLTQADLKRGSLDEATYRARLAARLEWLIDRTDDSPKLAVAALVQEMEAAGVWSGETRFPTTYEAVDSLIAENSAALRPLVLATDLQFPVNVRQMPAAVQAVRATDFHEWISRAFQAAGDR